MKKRLIKNYNIYLIVIYAIMVLVGIYLSSSSKHDNETGWINIALFVIVGVIFYNAIKAFSKTIKVSAGLRDATSLIESDFSSKNKMLWEEYKAHNGGNLFNNELLSEQYKKYVAEVSRLESMNDGKYRCDIEDYLNKELIDSTVKKNVFNLVPGTMTGLGILGTFIGLSIGLQNFNTGDAEQIAESIPVLMDGIKVAFHTSIYGMCFSLVFNYVFKQVIEDTYIELDHFLNAFDRYVCTNPENDSISNLQVALRDLPKSIGEEIALVMVTSFDKFNDTLSKFASDVSSSQVEEVTQLVDIFVQEMNESLGGNFEKLGLVIEDTCKLQAQNSEFMQNILGEIDRMTKEILEINNLSQETIDKFKEYIVNVEELQRVINDNFNSLSIQQEENQKYNETVKGYIDSLVEYEKRISDASDKFTKDMSKSVESLNKMSEDISKTTKDNLDILSTQAQEYTKKLADAAEQQIQHVLSLSNSSAGELDKASKVLATATNDLNNKLIGSVNNTFDVFDKELANITKHLSGTIQEVDRTTERVPQVVLDAYDGMKKSFDDMQVQVEGLIHSLDIMQRNLPKIIDEIEKK